MSYAVKEVDDDYYSRKKAKSSGKTPSLFKKSVDISKVNLPVIKAWIEETIHKFLPDDDIAVEFIYELLRSEELPNIHAIQEQMNDFLGQDESVAFCEKLWKLLLSAQKDPDGIPEQLLEQRKRQLERETEIQAKKMIAQLRLKPDYNRGRPSYNQKERRREYNSEKKEGGPRTNQRDIHREERRNRYEEKHIQDRTRARERSPVRQAGIKTNYNRSLRNEQSRGSYNRDRKLNGDIHGESRKECHDEREGDKKPASDKSGK